VIFCKVSHLAAPCRTVFDGSVLSGICHHQIVGLHTVTPVTRPWSLTWNLYMSPWNKERTLLGSIIVRFHFFLRGGGYFSEIIDNPKVNIKLCRPVPGSPKKEQPLSSKPSRFSICYVKPSWILEYPSCSMYVVYIYIHYITLHYMTWHYATLHYIRLKDCMGKLLGSIVDPMGIWHVWTIESINFEIKRRWHTWLHRFAEICV